MTARIAMSWIIGVHGLKRNDVWSKLWIIPVWDAAALCLWVASFLVDTFRWRGGVYQIRDGQLIPVVARSAQPVAIDATVMQEVPSATISSGGD
jgi:hypothetical protein